MRRHTIVAAATLTLAMVAGCRQQNPDSPPNVTLDESVCSHCNMIISDPRWATATIVDAPRGPEPRLFDDFNCQVDYEVEHPELHVLTRWSHSHATAEWIRTHNATFLLSTSLRTPMGSMVAAFASHAELQDALSKFPGEQMTFDAAWKHLGSTTPPDDSNPRDPTRSPQSPSPSLPPL